MIWLLLPGVLLFALALPVLAAIDLEKKAEALRRARYWEDAPYAGNSPIEECQEVKRELSFLDISRGLTFLPIVGGSFDLTASAAEAVREMKRREYAKRGSNELRDTTNNASQTKAI